MERAEQWAILHLEAPVACSLPCAGVGSHRPLTLTLTLTLTKVRLFRYATGKTRRTYDEGVEALHELQKGGDEAYRLEAFDFGRRMAVEREYRANQDAAPSSVCFDETGKLMLFA